MPRYAKTIPVAIAIQLLVNLNVVLASPISQTSPFPTSVHTPRSVQQLQSDASSAGTSVQQTAASLNGHKCPDPCFLNSLSLCDVIDSVTNPADYDRYCPAGISLPTFHEHIGKCKGTLSSQLGGFAGGLPEHAPLKGSESNTIGIGPWSGKPDHAGASSGHSDSVGAGSDKPGAGGFQVGGPSKGSDSSSVGVSLGSSSSKSSQTGASSGGSVTVDAGSGKPSAGGFQAGGPSKGSSDSISVGSTTVSIPSAGVLSGVDGLGSKGSSSGSGVVSTVSPTLGESKGDGAPGNKDGEGCGCGR